MKNNSFKHFSSQGIKPAKKLVLTGLLAAVLSGPYMYQISSKDFHFEEMASTAPELSEVDKLNASYRAQLSMVTEEVKKNPKYKDCPELPKAASVTDEPALKKLLEGIEAKKAAIDAKQAESELAKRVKAEEKKIADERDAAEKAEKERKEAAEKAEKKKKDDVAEAKRLDCNDKDKTASERADCREDAKREEKEKKVEEASKKFDERLEKTMNRCDRNSSNLKESDEDKELACKSKAFISALKSRDKDLSMAVVNDRFKNLLGDDLYAMLYSDDSRDTERASIILSNLFNGKVPTQYAGLKRMIMDEVRRRADVPAKKIQAEFKKALQLPAGTERTAQFTMAVAEKDELDNHLEAYSGSMKFPLEKSGDREALAYYRTSYTQGIEALIKRINSSVVSDVQGSIGGATRGARSRGGSNTEGRVVTTADGKMVHTTGGVEYSLVSPGPTKHISFGTPSSTRGTETRGGVRVNN